MTISSRALLVGFGALTLAAGFSAPAMAQQAEETTADASDEIVVTGTRVANRSRLDTIAPVDVITPTTLQQGTTELNQALSNTVPSFNFPRPAITDGTDSVRPATLRGLSPDQTLVLVNSKRRQTSALVNVNGSIGRGAAPVDLNTIPTAAIGSVEILRDGASAQYGSDAIAGVINVRLREASSGGNVTAQWSQRVTTVETNPQTPAQASPTPTPTWTIRDSERTRDVEDGMVWTTSGWAGLPLGEDGFLTLSAEYRDQGRTVRVAPDARNQFPLVAGAYSPLEVNVSRLNSLYGDPEVEQYTLFANAGYDLANGAELYGWASFQDRDALSSGFFRRPAQTTQNVASIFPAGFVPLINALVTDASAGGGVKFDFGGWDMDASLVWGSNEFEFVIRNTVNASLGAASPTNFEAGALKASQVVANLSAVQAFDMGMASPVNVAIGLEARRENFEQSPGAPNSYTDFDGPTGNAGGAQVFSGFQPSNRADEDRSAVGAYIDVEANLTEKLLVSGALRVENYSDFGDSFTGKLAARYDFNDGFALRGAASTGFRAPSLQQNFFSSVATNLTAAGLVEVGTFRTSSNVARALGGKPLEAEESENYSIGAVARAGNFSLTADMYMIKINDRIVLTENLTGTLVTNALTAAGVTNVSSARFFINGLDTETTGIDIVARYKLGTDNIGDFDFTFSGNLNNTYITRLPPRFGGVLPLFDGQNQLNFEDGQPAEKFSTTIDWSKGALGATYRLNYYGAITDPGLAQNGSQSFLVGENVLVDLEGRFAFENGLKVAVGAENVFDAYPDATPAAFNATGALGFSRFSPYGFNGRMVYARASFSW